MNKMKALIRYECATSSKAPLIFYGIEYAVLAAVMILIYFLEGTLGEADSSALEMNTIIFMAVLGGVGMRMDFKMLLQNGFARKYIYLASFSLFVYLAGLMALVDTVMAKVIPLFLGSYRPIIYWIYGDVYSVFINWLWLFLLYFFVSSLFYLVSLAIYKAGRTAALVGGATLVLLGMIGVPGLFLYLLPANITRNIITLLSRMVGFMADGTINFLCPILSLIVLNVVVGSASYALLRRTELK